MLELPVKQLERLAQISIDFNEVWNKNKPTPTNMSGLYFMPAEVFGAMEMLSTQVRWIMQEVNSE